jgi:hypothetical protein
MVFNSNSASPIFAKAEEAELFETGKGEEGRRGRGRDV